MVLSMTAFAREQRQFEEGVLSCECKSVNHRYLDAQFRLPEPLRRFEGNFRQKVRETIRRGKLEFTFSFQPVTDKTKLMLNTELASQLVGICDDLAALSKTAKNQLSLTSLLNWPGLLNQADIPEEVLLEESEKLLDAALASLTQAKQNEGEKLASIMLEKLSAMEQVVEALKPYQDNLYQQQKDKLYRRIEALDLSPDEARLEQELVLWLNKLDVAEELDRLTVHMGEFFRLLTAGQGAQGKRLDFLLQELNREANTLASKAQSSEATGHAVDLKVLIEQLREQVQNIE